MSTKMKLWRRETNKQTKTKKNKKKKKEITPLENKISLHWLHWSGLGMALSRFFDN